MVKIIVLRYVALRLSFKLIEAVVMKLSQLDTPALIVDLDVVEANLATMQQRIKNLNTTLRPHTKAHKIPALAHLQMTYGAVGICTSKLGEAEVMAAGGVNDILITTPIGGDKKYQRLINLHRTYPSFTFRQVIDHPQHVQAIAKHAAAAGIEVRLLIEVESGQQRCGVAIGDELVALIEDIQQTDGVIYDGLQAYSGHLQLIKGNEKRAEMARDAVTELFSFVENTLRPQGMAPDVISGGGTGTFEATEGKGFTEIQAGSFIFMDASYTAINESLKGETEIPFSAALKVLSTVISHPTQQRAVIDAGMKSLSIDLGMPIVEGRDDVRYQTGGDEHGILHLSEHSQSFTIGDVVTCIPSHCDTTLNNFDTLHAVRGDQVVQSWEISGRGRSD